MGWGRVLGVRGVRKGKVVWSSLFSRPGPSCSCERLRHAQCGLARTVRRMVPHIPCFVGEVTTQATHRLLPASIAPSLSNISRSPYLDTDLLVNTPYSSTTFRILRPSRQSPFTMQATTALSIRAIANKLHGPVILSQRESQQLLGLLTSSFQQHLDRYHSAGDDGNVKTSRAPPSRHVSRNGGQALLSSRASTNEHLLSILDHPLLNQRPKSRPVSFGQASSPREGVNPLPWLEEKIANGTVTFHDVRHCLTNLCGTRFVDQYSEARRIWLKELGAASKIISWLKMGGQSSQWPLFKDHVVSSQLAKLLVIEERRDVIWELLSEAQSLNEPLPITLVQYALATEARFNGIEEAMKKFISFKTTFTKLPERPCLRPIMAMLVVGSHTISSEVYDRFAMVVAKSKGQNFAEAVLTLYHPTSPSTDKALAFIRLLSDSSNKDMHIKTKSEHRVLVYTLLKLARTLIEQDEPANAHMVLRFAQDIYPVELGVDTTATKPSERVIPGPSDAELSNIERMDGLLAM